MNTRFFHKILTSLLILWMFAAGGFLCLTAHAAGERAEPELTAADQALFDYINQARQDPLAMAEAIGLNRAEVLADLPELQKWLQEGLPSLSFDNRLYNTAAAHTSDMLENNYYDYKSLDGIPYNDRLAAAGYVAAVSGEALGVLYFNNFIAEREAVFQLFANIFRDELRPERERPRNILNPALEEAGVSVGTGFYSFDGFSGNVYLASCDFGTEVALYDLQMLNLVNQARSRPFQVGGVFGVRFGEIRRDDPSFFETIKGPLQPLRFDQALYTAADGHARDMLNQGYYGHLSPDGSGPVERIQAAGYPAVWAGESLVRLSTCGAPVPPAQTVDRIFRALFLNAFRAVNPDRHLFAQQPAEAGIRIRSGVSEALGGICGDHLQLTVAEFAAKKDGPSACTELLGLIYADDNANGLYDPGEGAADKLVTINPAGEARILHTIKSNSAGGIFCQLPAGRYRLVMETGKYRQIQYVTVGEECGWTVIPIQ